MHRHFVRIRCHAMPPQSQLILLHRFNCREILSWTTCGSNSNTIQVVHASKIELNSSYSMLRALLTLRIFLLNPQIHAAYGLPWLKQPAHIFFNHQSFHHAHQHSGLNAPHPSSQVDGDNEKNNLNRRNSTDRIQSPTIKSYPPTSTAMPYYKNSAFKPVLGAHRSQLFNETVFNSTLLTAAPTSPIPNNRIDEPADTNFNNENEL